MDIIKTSLDDDEAGPQYPGPVFKTEQKFLPFRGVENDTRAYLPLNPKFRQIRYVAVDPGAGSEPISCFLGYISLKKRRRKCQRIPYEAVSYHWGDADDTVKISLRCAKRKSATARSPPNAWRRHEYNVTRNLEALFRAFRLPDRHRVLWVDAICINQADAAEKTHQVGDMGSIYSAAANVLIWLGEADLFSDVVIQTHRVFKESASARQKRPSDYVYWYIMGETKLGQLVVDAYHKLYRRPHEGSKWLLDFDQVVKIVLRSLNRCFSRPWFRRIWVLQEIVLAPITTEGERLATVCMGQSQIQWGELVNFAKVLGQLYDIFSRHSWFFDTIWSQFTTLPKGQKSTVFRIEQYLSMTTEFNASDPRDRIFAILQLAKDTCDSFKKDNLLRPDYSKPLVMVLCDYRRWELSKFYGVVQARGESFDTYKEDASEDPASSDIAPEDEYSHGPWDEKRGGPKFLWKKFRDQQALDYLIGERVARRGVLLPDMPSWATNILEEQGSKHLYQDFVDAFATYHATGSRTLVQQSTDSLSSISLKGLFITKIWEALTPRVDGHEELDALSRYLYKHRRRLWQRPQQNDNMPSRRVRTLREKHRIAIVDFGQPNYRNMNSGLLWRSLRTNQPSGLWCLDHPFTTGSPPIKKTRIYSTAHGEFVLTSLNVAEGDVIAIIYGARVPLVLRPVPETILSVDKKYKVIGPCFFWRDKWMRGLELESGTLSNKREDFFELV
jgi:hypothetical protein